MKKKTLFSQVLIIAILLSIFFSGTTQIFANWGLEVGRANEGDLAELAVNQSAMKVAQSRIANALIPQIGRERQLELLGLASNETNVSNLSDRVYRWWLKDVMGPAKAVATNPAASCAEAGVAMQMLIGMMRQRQLFDMATDEDTELGKMFGDVGEKVGLRCREEALDECVATGRFEQILILGIGSERQSLLMGGGDSDWQTWAKNSLKQCAFYDLHFVSTTHLDAMYTVDSVIDGKVKLKFVEDGGPVLGMTLKGETEGGSNPFLVSIKCQFQGRGGSIACSPGATPSSFSGKVFNFEMKHREFYVKPDGVSAERIVGDDKFVAEFRAGIFGIQLVVANRNPPMNITVPFPVGAPFAIAHNKDRTGQDATVKFENNKRGVLPTIFDFIYADQNAVGRSKANDSTHFELIHKIPDEILKKLYPPRKPEPPRQPLRPRSGVSG
ncbi:MAG TPA: hypothetical protein VEV84_05625 [Pyrinomonadaceae bacterium]|nr:hypothetical protein [Pyrinomonadaceae bacterium]